MDLNFINKGIIIGFSVAAPIGPIGVLCIRRTLAKGTFSGILTGLGASTIHIFYGVIAGFSLTLISGFLLHYIIFLQILGIIVLLYIGIKTFIKKPVTKIKGKVKKKKYLYYYLSSLALTITNPITIISFSTVFLTIGISKNVSNTYLTTILLILGIFIGSFLWRFILSNVIGFLRKRLSKKILKLINKVSGIIIIIFALIISINIFKF